MAMVIGSVVTAYQHCRVLYPCQDPRRTIEFDDQRHLFSLLIGPRINLANISCIVMIPLLRYQPATIRKNVGYFPPRCIPSSCAM